MKLKLFSTGKPSHNGFASCICWLSNDLFVTSGDDKKLLFWNAQSRNHEPVKSIQLNMDAYPVSMDYALQNASSNTQSSILETASTNLGQAQSNQVIAIGTSNGKVYLFPIGGGQPQQSQQSSQQMKKFDAHQGAVIVIRWSPDLSTLASAGEDGLVKIWSKMGMLRSTLSQSDSSIYCVAWCPDSNSLAYGANGGQLIIKSLSPQSRSTEWLAHEGITLSLDWNRQNHNRILSSGEDGRINIWDINGNLFFSTSANQSSIPTCVCWSPSGEYFAVSSFLSLKLYHPSGNIATVEKLSFEGVFSLGWSPDSNQLAMVCANGSVIFVNLLEQTIETNLWQITNTTSRTIVARNHLKDINETLEFSSSIIRFSFAFEQLVVVTASQCLIYNTTNWTSPNYFDLRLIDLILLVIQTDKYFLLVGSSFNATIYEYSGRLVKTIKLNNMKLGSLQSQIISLNNQYLAYKDATNQSTINLISLFGKNRTSSYRHSLEIISVKLSPESKDNEQIVVFNDVNQDLYSLLMRNDTNIQMFKLSSMIDDFIWHSEFSILVGLNENQTITLWLYPQVAYVDANLLQDIQLLITVDTPQSSSARSTKLSDFIQNQITLIKNDNVQIYATVNPFITLVHRLKHESRWNDAVKMCNIINEFNSKDANNLDKVLCNALWASLAVMALEAKQFETSEIAYAAIDRIEKVIHLNNIKALQQKDVQALELELMRCNIDAAETGFIQKGYILRAVILNLSLYRWNRALKLATQFNSKVNNILLNDRKISLIEVVLSNRQNFIQIKSKNETFPEFLDAMKNFDEIIEWKSIEPSIKLMLYER